MLSGIGNLKRAVSDFKSEDRGTVTIEFIIFVPLLVWSFLALVVFWDGFKTANANQRSAYLVADLISREVDTLDVDYLEGVSEVARTLNDRDRSSQLRVTAVNRALDPSLNPIHEIAWSWGGDTLAAHTDIRAIEDRLPMMAVGDQLIYVEAVREWAPRFAIAQLDPMRFEYVAVTIPRFAPQIVFDDGSGL